MPTESFDPKNVPLPVSYYQTTYGVSRTSLWRMETQQGLRILHVGGKRFIRPSDWNAFLENQHAKSKAVPS